MSRHGLLRSLFAAAALLGAAGVFAASAEPLRLEVYNPGEKAIFAVSSELLVGQREAMLIDAQFSRADAEQLVKRIQAMLILRLRRYRLLRLLILRLRRYRLLNRR